ncbi:SSU ribosomal protein S4E (rps4E) [Archaeoglobus fulgidus DSM 4304]|uniref:Small ribosomal subunit protein eS4 n=1 Tax=Archaeoglobus fulgidus (strain ATCC 49558 / DSM 4304 / JCM 9628 / NBRC 100126 / VC-16) TaxID=224325 RepID=RS4E_ARCFU|nr:MULTISPECIES: 30S ribosomal protein S4e [Archaeoglobus]O28366.1 RecName: Full=Small ribosomal subunit protein eS4; AltName: Full=30S ribosomal protein S4e [Archaeoglobus fulgidus DSM 4304]AAB89340.1 SSU ribosomal protein S4E (rps4E) [Archaeoglobus fulgidus DSM 4304]
MIELHQKRLSAPKTYKIPRKVSKWVVKPSPGPHNKEAIPLLVLVRDFLELADTGREARRIISAGEILVDGVVRKDYKFPVGLFDVVTIPKLEKSYRILFDEKGRYIPKEVEDADLKLYKITNKTLVRGGKVQLNLFDGTNILGSNDYKTKDSILLRIPEKEVVDHLKFEEGALVMITGGTHAGEIGRIKSYKIVRSSAPNLVTVEGEERDITTIEDYVFVVGKKDSDKPVIDLGV